MEKKNGYTNVELNQIIKKLPQILHFQGIYSANTIPDFLISLNHFSIICNLSKQEEKGTHWVTIIYHNGVLLYLDPLSLNLQLSNDISAFIAKLQVKLIFTLDSPIQNPFSTICGLFCVLFILLFDKRGLDLTKFKQFSPNTSKNNYICKQNLALLSIQYQ